MKKKQKILIVIGIIVGILSVTGVSFALWSKTFFQTGDNTIASDCFQIVFLEGSGTSINLENSFPMFDADGKRLTPYTFSITNTCDSAVEYQLNLETTNQTTMKDSYIKVMLNEETPALLSSKTSTTPTITNGKSAYILESGTLSGNTKNEYTLRIWMDENVSQNDEGAMNSLFESKITIVGKYATKYIDPILKGADPVLADGLIPVTIQDDGTVIKADVRSEWYKYENKEWANAVILEDESIVYQNGEEIPESNIESYFVWIPRFRYKIFNEGTYTDLTAVEDRVQRIEIEFENKNTVISTGSTVGSWLTHPAFTAFDSNGMWVGKFETGYKGANTSTEAEQNTYDVTKVEIKPNVYSWRGIQVANAHLNAYNYQRNFDSHLIKNTEWGAVAYLQHSQYGSMASVRFNNSSTYITGSNAVTEPTCGYIKKNADCNKYEATKLNMDGIYTKRYNSSMEYMASTTGNISGIYDMSGGAWEYVMGIVLDQSNNPLSGRNNLYNSGFNGIYGCPTCDTDKGNDTSKTSLTNGVDFPNAKYYDAYVYSTKEQIYANRILGDATGEMGPFGMMTYETETRQIGSWYEDDALFVSQDWPWFARGGDYAHGSNTGIFSFANQSGNPAGWVSYRIVLSV